MPTYDYECEKCSHTLEIFQSFKESPKKKCPKCGKLKLRRIISGGVGLVFKGSGFYVTDSRKESSKSDKRLSEAKGNSTAKKDSKTSSESKSSATKTSNSNTVKTNTSKTKTGK